MPREPSPWRDPPWVLVMARRDPREAWNSGQYNGHQRGAGAETGDCSGKKTPLESLHVHCSCDEVIFVFIFSNAFAKLDNVFLYGIH